MVVLFPLQMEAVPDAVPATEAGVIDTVMVLEFTAAHTPFVITAR